MAIYFIQQGDDGPIKIGYTNNDPYKRLKELQTATPYELKVIGVMEGGRKREKSIHNKFSEIRINGEWFRNDDALQTYIENKTAKSGWIELKLKREIFGFQISTKKLFIHMSFFGGMNTHQSFYPMVSGKEMLEDKNGNKYVIFDVLYDYPQWKASDIDNLKDQLMDAVNEFTK